MPAVKQPEVPAAALQACESVLEHRVQTILEPILLGRIGTRVKDHRRTGRPLIQRAEVN